MVGCSSNEAKKEEAKEPETKKVLRVGVTATYNPWCYKEGEEIVGVDVDILKEVAKRMHYNEMLEYFFYLFYINITSATPAIAHPTGPARVRKASPAAIPPPPAASALPPSQILSFPACFI